MSLDNWTSCPYCEGGMEVSKPHTVRDCIDSALYANQWGDDNSRAEDIIDALKRRGFDVSASLTK